MVTQPLVERRLRELEEDITTVYLFGSFGTSVYNPHSSDIDLAIITKKELSLMEEMKISAKISIILERDRVDVIHLNKARVDICHEILATGEIIYEEDAMITADFLEKTLQHYFDFGIPLQKIKVDFFNMLKEEAGVHDR